MGIKINQNIFSLLVQRNLDKVTGRLEQSYNKISSGQRINRSADDPSGLASSEQMRYEMQGLRQNQQNVGGALSLVGSAESHLNNLNTLLQRARELTLQGANEILNATNRQAVQLELTQIVEEINRIATTSKFNEYSLFNGDFQGRRIQVGTRAIDTLNLTLPDLRQNVFGTYARVDSDQAVSAAAIATNDITLNGIAVPPSVSDGVSNFNPTASALAKANAINGISAQTGVRAEARPTRLAGTGAAGPVNLDGTVNFLRINGVNIGAVAVQAGDASGALAEAINARQAQSGVKAAIDDTGALVLTAADGRNIEVTTGGAAGTGLGLTGVPGPFTQTASAKVRLISNNAFTVDDANQLLGFTALNFQTNPNPTTAIEFISVADLQSANDALQTIDTALRTLSDQRSSLGAVFNRLESLTDALARQVEDLTSADSAIRDTDFALETARLTQNQILQEAAIAMLTQANVTPRRALELLRG